MLEVGRHENEAISKLQEMLGIESQLRVERMWGRDPSDLNIAAIDILSDRSMEHHPRRSWGSQRGAEGWESINQNAHRLEYLIDLRVPAPSEPNSAK